MIILKSHLVNNCPRHILDPAHYTTDSCFCVQVQAFTGSEKKRAALAYQCPVCKVAPGNLCLNQNSSRRMVTMKYPHPERTRIVDPDFKGDNFQYYERYRKTRIAGRIRRIAGEDFEQTDQRNLEHVRRPK